jgi:hypothetical protein
LLPECLDDFITEDNPIRVVQTFIEQLDLTALESDGVAPSGNRSAVLPPCSTAEDLPLRLPQSHPVQPAPGARMSAQP